MFPSKALEFEKKALVLQVVLVTSNGKPTALKFATFRQRFHIRHAQLSHLQLP
jgi:hypothetical protein